MTPARIRELRRAGVLTRRGPLTRADRARIALLEMVDVCRKAAPVMREDPDSVLAGEILFYLDPLMRNTPRGRALRWAAAQAGDAQGEPRMLKVRGSR